MSPATLAWVLIMYVPQLSGATVDSAGAITLAAPIRVEINMPSRDVCEQIATLNSNEAECWAHEPPLPTKPKDQPK